MTDPTNDAAGERPLQFDAAEPTAASDPLACTACATQIRGYYHEVNGAVVCSRCRQAAEGRLRGGSSVGRFARALALGAGAAFVGAALYFGIAVVSGYELGLIAIVVGWLVGRAVHRGSRGRGGWRYQALAVALTYAAIVVTYMPHAMVRTMGVDPRTANDSVLAEAFAADSLADAASADSAGDAPTMLAVAAASNSAALADATADATAVPAAVAIVFGLAVMFVLALAEPFRQGPENIMGLIIIAIGLYQAWYQTKAAAITITGPYRIGTPRTSDAP